MENRAKVLSRRGDAGVTVLAVIAVVALVGWAAPKLAPHWFDKRTKQADDSAEVTQLVEKRVAAALEGETKKGAVVAASLQVIGQTAAEAGDAPWAVFIRREADHVAPLLPAADYKALYAAEARKRAVLEGKIELADKLYKKDAEDKQRLLDESAGLRIKLAKALQERRDVDKELSESAAAAAAKDAVIGFLAAVVVLCFIGWTYARLNGISVRTLGMMSADLRAGHDAKEVLDRYVPVRLWPSVKKARVKAEIESHPELNK